MSDHKPNEELGLSSADTENLGLSEEDLEQVAGGNDPDASAPLDSTTIITTTTIITNPDYD